MAHWAVRIVVAGGVALWLFLLAFPEFPEPVKPGLDPAWIYGINQAKVLGLSFGSDILYTYGPLGYLLDPLDLGRNLVWAVAFGIVFAATLSLVVGWAVGRSAGGWNGLIAAVCLSPALRLGLDSDKRLALAALVATVIALERPPARGLSAALAAFAAVATLIRFGLGLIVGATLTLLLLVQWRRGAITWRWLLACGGVGGATLVVGFALAGNRPGDLGAYLHYSLQFATAYNEAMAFAGPAVDVALAFACAGYFLAVALAMQNRTAQLSALTWAPAFALAFKHGFVRQDPRHLPEFFIVFFGALGCLALTARSWRERTAVVLGLAVGLTGYTAVLRDRQRPTDLAAWFDPRLGVARLQAYRDFRGLRQRVGEASASGLRALALSPPLRTPLQEGTVDVIPVQATYVEANNLRWNPRPLFQSFAVQSPVIDRLNAAHYTAATAPDFVLYAFEAIDSHHPLFEEPATMREVLCRYEVAAREQQLMVLRRAVARCGALVPVEQRTIGWYVDVPVLAIQDGLQVRLDIRYSWRGALTRTFLRAPPVTILFTYEDGKRLGYRLAPGLAGNGLWLGHLPRDLDGVQALLSGQPLPEVRSFRLEAAREDFEPEIGVEFLRMPVQFGAR